MNEHFIKNIEIKNFKCFENFKAEGFGRVNLIGGKNNVGKTAFMEATLLINQLQYDSQHFFSALMNIEDNRANLGEINNEKFIKLLTKFAPLELLDNFNHMMNIKLSEDKLKLVVTSNDKEMIFDNTKMLGIFKKHSSSFISSNSINNETLQILYDGVKRNRKRENFNQYIETFDSDLTEVDVIDNTFKIFSISRNDWISIFEYGDGIRHYIAYISAIWANKDGVVFLDEIENGIHYSNLDKLWEIILTISKEQNVQVFATTHSKECIESYARVAKKLEETDIKFLSLYKNKKDELKSITLDYQTIQDRIELGLDNR